MDGAMGKKLHFLLFPFLAQGHINPFLQLSRALAIHGHRVSFLSTPVNISRIKSSLLHRQDWPGQIELLELPLPPADGLTPGAECTADIPNEMLLPLAKAIDCMEKPVRDLLGQVSPDFVIHDVAHYWMQRATAGMNVPAILFLVFSPASCAYALHPSKLRNPHITADELAAPPPGFPSSTVSSRLYEAREFLFMYRAMRPGHVSPMQQVAKGLEGCVAVAVKSCFEEEEKYIRYYQDAIGVPVLSVGPLMPVSCSTTTDQGGSDLLEWLDRQRPSSVVFVSFGSETFLSREQICELALGLESTALPFLWSLRSPPCVVEDPRDLLPDGFEIRTADRGLIVCGWVPQVRIFSHPSIGGCLSHGGWSSVMEALSFGVPLLLLPINIERSLNARQIAAELKAAIEIERGDDGSFLRENIATTLRMVMAGDEGKTLRSKAAEVRDIINANNGRQQNYIHDFIQQLERVTENCKKKSMSYAAHQ